MLKLLGFYFLLLRAAFKSCKSPEILIINVYLRASPEIVWRAIQRFQSKVSVGIDRTGGLMPLRLSSYFRLLHANHLAVSPEGCSVHQESVQILGQKARGGVPVLPSEFCVRATEGFLSYLNNGRSNSSCFLGLLERSARHPSVECPASSKGQGGGQHLQLLFASQNEGWLHEKEKTTYYKKPFFIVTVADDDILEFCP